MKQCPLCDSAIPDSTSICDCGYDFEKGEVRDKTKVNSWVNAPNIGWAEKVRRKKKVQEIQEGRYRKKVARSNNARGWTQEKTAEMLDESTATLSRDLSLAEALDAYPDLKSIKKKSKAMKRLKEIKTGMPAKDDTSFGKEDELQEYLFNNWDKTPFAEEWGIHKKWTKGKFDTGKVGIIDLLAKHKTEPKWLVIELKIDRSSDVAVGQVLRYMGWVKRELARDEEVVEGLIISKSPHKKICYALVCTTNINYKLYRLEEGKIQLSSCDIENYDTLWAIKDMTLEQRKEFARELEQMKPD